MNNVVKQKHLLLVDRISLTTFLIILYLKIRFRHLKILCGSLPSKTVMGKLLEERLIRSMDVSFVFYEHMDLYGSNIPEVLIEDFGKLKDNVNERSYFSTERLFEEKIAKSLTFKNFFEFFYSNERIKNAFKKAVLILYSRKLINLFECGRILMESNPSKDPRIFLLLSRDFLQLWDIYADDYNPFNRPVDVLLRPWFRFENWVAGLFAAIAVSSYTFAKILLRLAFGENSDKHERRKGIWISSGVNYNFLTRFFLETTECESRFSVKDALFLMEGPDTGKMREYAVKHGIKCVYPKKMPVSGKYFLKEFIGHTFFPLILRQVAYSFVGEGNLVYWRVMHESIINKINIEILAERYGVKLYLSARYFDNNAVKTIIINRCGGKTASYQFGDVAHPMTNLFLNAYSSVNEMFLYGEGTIDEFRKYGQLIEKYHVVGSDRLDSFQQYSDKDKELKNKYDVGDSFVLVVFGPAYNETIPRKRNVMKFYSGVFEAFKEIMDRDLKLLIKAHKKSNMADGETDFPELAALINTYKNHNKVKYYYYENPYELMMISDLVITWSTSTTGLESIVAGKNTIFFDPMNSRFHPYRIYNSGIVVSNGERLQELVLLAIEGKFPVPKGTYKNIVQKYCYPNDGQSFQRILDRLWDIVEKKSKSGCG